MATGHTMEHDLNDTRHHQPCTSDEFNTLITDSSLTLMYRGFDRRFPDSIGSVDYDKTTRTFSITPIVTTTVFYAGGTQYIKSATESIVWPDISGSYYFYFDIAGVLQVVNSTAVTEEIFIPSAICGLCYWNAILGEVWHALTEQHGVPPIGFNPPNHLYHHMKDGFSWLKGGELTGVTDGSSTFTALEWSWYKDEDLSNFMNEVSVLPFRYREGVDGPWRLQPETPDNTLGYKVGGLGNVVWNENIGGTWQLTAATSTTDYIIYFIERNNMNIPASIVVGQEAFPSRSTARTYLANYLLGFNATGLPSTELAYHYAFIMKADGTLEDDGNGNPLVDLRGVKIKSLASS